MSACEIMVSTFRQDEMKILSHRGFWLAPDERNGATAFERSFSLGFGTETDLRDLDGGLVVAHDPPRSGVMTAEEMFTLHARHDAGLPLALNVKCDGLQTLLAPLLEQFAPRDAFVFDMAIPDMLGWLRAGVPVFTRHSDVEPDPVLADRAAGVWLDGFHSDWWDASVIGRHLDAGLRVCIVSPELHGRDHRPVWDRLAGSEVTRSQQVMLCTDHPADAKEVFAHDH